MDEEGNIMLELEASATASVTVTCESMYIQSYARSYEGTFINEVIEQGTGITLFEERNIYQLYRPNVAAITSYRSPVRSFQDFIQLGSLSNCFLTAPAIQTEDRFGVQLRKLADTSVTFTGELFKIFGFPNSVSAAVFTIPYYAENINLTRTSLSLVLANERNSSGLHKVLSTVEVESDGSALYQKSNPDHWKKTATTPTGATRAIMLKIVDGTTPRTLKKIDFINSNSHISITLNCRNILPY